MEKISIPCGFLWVLLLSLASFTAIAIDTRDAKLTKYISSCEVNPQSPEERYRACQQHCERTQLQHRPQCRQKCIDEYRKEQRKDDNPYAFEEQHFTTIKSQHGRLRILQKFLDRSKFLSGIDKYRFGFLEAEPYTFFVPAHYDADLLCIVLRGRGKVTLLRSKGSESLNLQKGDIYRIPAGTTVYLINIDKREKVEIAWLIQPISTPGEFKEFFGAGGENPKSFLKTFSPELLEAAFKVNRDRLQEWLGQREGFVVKASEEQIRALSDHAGGKGLWPSGESKRTINILRQRPIHSNKYGEIRDVKPDDLEPFQDLNVGVALANMTQGAMSTMFFNSKSTKICVVPNGEGYIQMACPHLSSSSSEESEQGHGDGGFIDQSNPGYVQVTTRLRPGIVFIAPPGHPLVMVASNNQNLEVLCFVINARNNERTPLAGGNNIWNQMEEVGLELAFNMPSEEVKSILKSQKKEWFMKGPRS
ncbi:vicilin Cor a 11.0101-like [Apium graveolens]|uniref:vicilin Cor a 11.0101-like n=1 Tax=Apium graveolens TaxID=4045 RepID=UPI003D79407B